VDIFDLLSHHLFVLNQLRVRAFLPHLVLPILFVSGPTLRQLPEHILGILPLDAERDLNRSYAKRRTEEFIDHD